MLQLAELQPHSMVSRAHKKRATRVRAYNYIKVATRRNFLPVLKIVTCTAQAVYNVNVAMRARDQSSIFSTGGKFRP